jgi:hypothetical protein
MTNYKRCALHITNAEPNHCFCGMGVCSLYYPACKAHAPCYIIMCPVLLCHIFPRYFINGMIFEKKLLIIKCVVEFSLHILPEIFRILRTIKRDIINAHRSSCKVPFILVIF